MHLRPFYHLFALCLVAVAACGQTITGFSVNYGAPGDPVRIDGSGFAGVTNVYFNGRAVTSPCSSCNASCCVTADNQVNVTVPSGAPSGPITVKKPGSSATSIESFTVIGPGPYIIDFTPTNAAVGTGVTLNGAHFTPFQTAGTIKFNGTSASYFAPTTDTQLTVVVPPGATTGPISATTTAGTWTSSNLFYFPPGVQSFSPANGRPGTNVVIKGTNFLGLSKVTFGGASATVLSNSNTQITAVVPGGATSGTLNVIAPAGQFVSSSNFFVLPDVISFSPFAGAIGTTVTINGANLNGANLVVRFNGAAAPILSTNFSQLVVLVPNGATSGAISVQSNDGTGSSVTNFFLPPTISAISPTSGAVGSTVTITGQNLTNATSVQFNGVNATSYTVVANTQITAVVPAGPTSGQITVVTPGGSAQSLDAFFGAPIITLVSPPAGVIGVSVTISGTNFFGTTSVKFNGVSASFVNLVTNSTDTIFTTVPSGATTGPISVTGYGGTVNSSSFFIEPLLLSITNLDASTVRVAWTTNAPGFGLQTTTNLLSTNNAWANETNATQLIGGKVTFTNNTTGFPKKYYRLIK